MEMVYEPLIQRPSDIFETVGFLYFFIEEAAEFFGHFLGGLQDGYVRFIGDFTDFQIHGFRGQINIRRASVFLGRCDIGDALCGRIYLFGSGSKTG